MGKPSGGREDVGSSLPEKRNRSQTVPKSPGGAPNRAGGTANCPEKSAWGGPETSRGAPRNEIHPKIQNPPRNPRRENLDTPKSRWGRGHRDPPVYFGVCPHRSQPFGGGPDPLLIPHQVPVCGVAPEPPNPCLGGAFCPFQSPPRCSLSFLQNHRPISRDP